MAKPAYKFTDFVDLLLVALYEADQSDNGDGFQDLGALAATIKGDVPRDWVFDAAKVLETRMLADCIFTFGAPREDYRPRAALRRKRAGVHEEGPRITCDVL